jgi:phosphoribosylformylglycinamidine cyclo-ligase
MTDVVIDEGHNVGQLLLSPTRTYAPVVKDLLANNFEKIHGLVHCSGGGQTKCLKFIPNNVRIVKDNLFEAPYIFQIIKECSGADLREMMQVFNMGCRLEVFISPENAQVILDTAAKFGIEARITGRVEVSDKKSLEIQHAGETIIFE